jgi:hypothetical protein
MDIGDWVSSAEMNNTFRKARSLDLESNLLELEVFGFTIIEPEKAAPAGLAERLLEATLALIEREDPAHVALNTYEKSAVDGRHLFHLPLKDPAFAEALMNPVVMTLARYTTGQLGRLHATVGFVKSEIGKPTRLHCDATGVTAPMPPYGTFVNISYILTDYTEASGTLAIVPGSNRWCRLRRRSSSPNASVALTMTFAFPLLRSRDRSLYSAATHGTAPTRKKRRDCGPISPTVLAAALCFRLRSMTTCRMR